MEHPPSKLIEFIRVTWFMYSGCSSIVGDFILSESDFIKVIG